MGQPVLHSPYVEAAKAAIRIYVEDGGEAEIRANGVFRPDGEQHPTPCSDFSPLFGERAGVFVSIKKLGALRGCIGTISPTQSCVADEIVQNAISACSRDPRFDPVAPGELGSLAVSVDVLGKAEPVISIKDLDVLRYGVIVSKGYRRGLLLPNLEGVDTVEYQLQIALSKAGIGPGEKYSIERFEVVCHDAGGAMAG